MVIRNRDVSMTRYLIGCLLAMILAAYAGQAGAGQPRVSPAQFVITLLDAVKKVKKADPENNIFLSPEEKKQNEALARVINPMVNIRNISIYALMHHWNGLGDQERTFFVSVLTELLTDVAYPSAGKFLQDLEVAVRKEKVIKTKAMVYTSVVHKEEGRIDIDFKLHRSQTSWEVADVYLDGVSLARNLRTQCLKIIRDHSFKELVARMRKKIEEKNTAQLEEVTGRN